MPSPLLRTSLLLLYPNPNPNSQTLTLNSMGRDGANGSGNGGLVVASAAPPPNPLVQLQARFKEVEAGFRSWLAKQPTAVEAVVVTTTGVTQGAAIGGLMGSLTVEVVVPPPTGALIPRTWLPSSKASLKQAQVDEDDQWYGFCCTSDGSRFRQDYRH